ncbi:glycosyltransferase family A protein [Arcicella sp. LKC2W]|uniref:glycosyltransferase family A protein n=1 Tax=Arcicella sp. LKC2W TaxID=2984198 RepID=UPI002B20584B|nr:glycosyltransferase family A protein [Arcicella sp. LKC2W]MEA5461285.1 glycosyltransferase family A protein [Arcicella sp. LKC2W]
MNIYIKSFNRPFYLDRCIRSIKFNISNYTNIIILDDGTLSKYIKKLEEIHPDVKWISSGADDNKFELLRNEQFEEIKRKYIEPAEFWFNELLNENGDYFLLLEDDVWLVQSLNLELIKHNLINNNCVILKFWWNILEQPLESEKIIYLPNNNEVNYFSSSLCDLSNIGIFWIVAFAIYRKDFWLNNFKKVKRMGDEQTQFLNAFKFIREHRECSFAKTNIRFIHQGWAVPGRSTPEYYDKGLKQHLFMDALNESWYNDEIDIMQNYPFDFEETYLVPILGKHLSEELINVWLDWKKNDVIYSY